MSGLSNMLPYIYRMKRARDDIWRLFWAKTNRDAPDGLPTRPLWAHLIDVATAARLLWDEYVPAGLKERIAADLDLSIDEAGDFLSLWIGLHDVGKAIPFFQAQHAYSKGKLGKYLYFKQHYGRNDRLHHGHASIAILQAWLTRQDLPEATQHTLESTAAFVGFHHGRLCTAATWYWAAERGLLGGTHWHCEQQALADAVIEAWGLPDLTALPQLPATPDWLLGFAGWVTLADWIGSMAEHYDDIEHDADLEAYRLRAEGYAGNALKAAGLHVRPALRAESFRTVFPWIAEPRDLQTALADLPDPDEPELLIVEAPTGEGKTEGALYRAARHQHGESGQGIYVAMPSQATSNMLFERVRDQFLPAAHPEGVANLRLIHGNDLLHDDLEQMLVPAHALASIYDDDTDASPARTISWFLPRKRGLLAPYSVGTVDQAFLGVLYARHFFLRLFGLAGKTIIFDEVHAYDTYMSMLFERLLQWLKALGAHVILLSATLPRAMRERFLQAWNGDPETADDPEKDYPIIWRTTGGDVEPVPFDATSGREQCVTLRWSDHDVAAVAKVAQRWLDEGAAVGVICNTVARAQQVYEVLEGRLPDEDTILFHARFPFAQRSDIEKQVRERFGKDDSGNPRASGPALLVATQVAEQSLDFDVDVMLSDLAPVDLLLQRAGRLWRHVLPEPRPVDEPVFVVLRPEDDEPLPVLDDLGGWISNRPERPPIYDPVVLWKTLHVLRQHGGWSLPVDYRVLIETVYDGDREPSMPLDDAARDRWEAAITAAHNAAVHARQDASGRLVPSPAQLEVLFESSHLELAESDEASPGVHRDYQALTRQAGPSMEVICLHRDDEGLWLDAEGTKPAPFALNDENAAADIAEIGDDMLRQLLGASVRLGSEEVERRLAEAPVAWTHITEANTMLSRYRPLVFERGHAEISDRLTVRFDPILGLIYESAR